MSTRISCFDLMFSNLVGLYYFNGKLDISKLQESLDHVVKKIPTLSSVITKRGDDYYLDHVTPNSVKIGVVEDVDEKYYEFYLPNNEGILKYEEGNSYFKLFKSIETNFNMMEPVLNKPVLEITLLITKETERSIICVSINHAVADAHTLTYFISTWSGHEKFSHPEMKFDISRERFNPSTKNFLDFDIEKEIDPKILKLVEFYHPHRPGDIGLRVSTAHFSVQKVIHFSKQRIEQLKKMVKVKEGTIFSSNDCVCAHMWKLYASTLTNYGLDSVLPFKLVINIRERVKGVKNNFMGNAVIAPNINLTKKEILESDYSTLIMKIRTLINSVDSNLVKSIIDCWSKYNNIASKLWRKTDLMIDDLRLVDTLKPSNFGNKNENLKCERVLLNPPMSIYTIPQMMYVNCYDNNNKGISITAVFENEVYDVIKEFDFSDPSEIPKIYETLKKEEEEE